MILTLLFTMIFQFYRIKIYKKILFLYLSNKQFLYLYLYIFILLYYIIILLFYYIYTRWGSWSVYHKLFFSKLLQISMCFFFFKLDYNIITHLSVRILSHLRQSLFSLIFKNRKERVSNVLNETWYQSFRRLSM